MRVGQPVMLVRKDEIEFLPPLGSCGVITRALDEYGDHAVAFDHHLCPNPPGTDWECPAHWLIPLTWPPAVGVIKIHLVSPDEVRRLETLKFKAIPADWQHPWPNLPQSYRGKTWLA